MQEGQHRNALSVGHKIHWYAIESVLGQGGFGITYLALDTNLGQQVAIKEYLPSEIAVRNEDGTVQPRSNDDAEQFKWGLIRFQEEARTLAKFDHPNIVRVYSVFESNNTAYLVMRYEEGESLRDLLKRRKYFSEEELLDVVLPILDGLSVVHDTGFIHRDVQPANIFIRRDGAPVLLDFGAARQTSGESRTLTILVAPGYAPIEQYYSESSQQGPWTDIYGIGATLYRAIAGIKPIDAIERSRGMLGSTRDVLVPAKVAGQGRYSEEFLEAIDHALKFSEKERPQTATEFSRELKSDGREANKDTAPVFRADTADQSTRTEINSRPETVNELPSSAYSVNRKQTLRWTITVVVFAAGIGLGMFLLKVFDDINTTEEIVTQTNSSDPADLGKESQPVSAAPIINDAPELVAADQASIQSAQTALATDNLPQTDAQNLLQATAEEESSATPGTVPGEKVAATQKEMSSIQSQMQEEATKIAAMREELSALKAARAAEQKRMKNLEQERRKEEERSKMAAATKTPQADPVIVAPTKKAKVELPPVPAPDPLQDALASAAAGNYPAAVAMLEPLAIEGNAVAQYHLAGFYHEGRGVLANNMTALEWMRKAAWQGQTDAQVALARMYLNGINGVRDVFLAYTWFLVAERNGIHAIAAQRNETEDSLQPEQLPQAAALASELQNRAR